VGEDGANENRYLVPYSLVARDHGYAIDNGTIVPGEAQIL
jgi:hypothetical protein